MRARSSQKLRALRASETAKRLVEEHEGNIRSQQGSCQPNPLAWMVGHRTRLAQLRPEARHEREDESLATYQEDALEADRVYGFLSVAKLLWLPLGLVGLAPSFILGEATLGRLAVALGGTILAARALQKLADGLADLLDAGIAWERIAPLFHAASRGTAPGDPNVLSLSRRQRASANGRPLLEVKDLSYRYPTRSEPAIRGTSFGISLGSVLKRWILWFLSAMSEMRRLPK